MANTIKYSKTIVYCYSSSVLAGDVFVSCPIFQIKLGAIFYLLNLLKFPLINVIKFNLVIKYFFFLYLIIILEKY